MSKTVVIGLDSADWHFLEKFMEEGDMPNLEEIKEKGVHGKLRSIDPPLSMPAWMCFATGKRPDKLDIYNFRVLEPGTNDMDKMPDFSSLQDDLFWKEMDYGAIGVPTVFPTKDRDPNGFTAAGPFVPDRSTEDISDLVDSYDYTARVPNLWRYDEGLEHMEMEGEFTSEVLEERDPEFFICVTSVTDRLQHSYCKDMEKMRKLYRRADNYLGKVLDHFEEDNIFIVSDHGYSEIKKVFYINTWLEEQGLLEFNDGGGSPSRLKEDLRYRVKNLARDVFSTLGVLDLAMDVIPERFQSAVRDKEEVWDKIDWGKTEAFAMGGYVGQIYINTEDRPKGDVSPKEYEEIREEIIEGLRGLEDPETSDKVVGEVWKKEEIYRDFAERAPDIMFYPKNMSYKVNDGFHGKIFDESVPNGSHGLQGVFLAKGENITSKKQLDLHLTDVAPTILHMMDREVPKEMDGEVRMDIFREGSEPREREVNYSNKELEGLDF